jgi:hypothetical protein
MCGAWLALSIILLLAGGILLADELWSFLSGPAPSAGAAPGAHPPAPVTSSAGHGTRPGPFGSSAMIGGVTLLAIGGLSLGGARALQNRLGGSVRHRRHHHRHHHHHGSRGRATGGDDSVAE